MDARFTQFAAITALVLVPAIVAGGETSAYGKKADAVRATPAEMKFTKIPWITDVFEGFRLARLEKRPVFLYVVTGDPLDDC